MNDLWGELNRGAKITIMAAWLLGLVAMLYGIGFVLTHLP